MVHDNDMISSEVNDVGNDMVNHGESEWWTWLNDIVFDKADDMVNMIDGEDTWWGYSMMILTNDQVSQYD